MLLLQLSIIETFPQLIGYDPEVYDYFKEQSVSSGGIVRLNPFELNEILIYPELNYVVTTLT